MRFFIALEIPEESRKELERVQSGLKEIFPQARLTDNEKLHLTVAFIGEQPEYLKDELAEVMRKAAADIPPFAVTPAYIDGFPTLHQANILWVGVKGDIDKLFLVRERVKDGLVRLGLPVDERRYVPHIAVAKFRDFHLPPERETELEKLAMAEFSPIQITSLKLFESIPQDGFHRHNTLAEIPLQ